MHWKKILSIILLITWCFILIEVLVLKQLPLVRVGQMKFHFGGTQEGKPNFIPFKTILFYLKGSNGLLIGAINLLGNIGLLIPIGLILPNIFNKMKQIHISLIALSFGFVIELIQAVLHIGIFDIDDVILNALGVIIGFASYLRYEESENKLWRRLFQVIISFSMVCFIVFSIYYCLKNHSFPIALSNGDAISIRNQKDNTDTFKTDNVCCDLCGGTGGIGKIVSLTSTNFDVLRKEGLLLHVSLKTNATIKSNQGTILFSNVAIGDHVTLVGDAIDDNHFLAAFVFVCQKDKTSVTKYP